MKKYIEYLKEIVQFYTKLLKYVLLSLVVFTSSICNFYLISFYLPSLFFANPIVNGKLKFYEENQACLNYIIKEKGEPDMDGLYIPYTTGL
jgi:hypothetical protein